MIGDDAVARAQGGEAEAWTEIYRALSGPLLTYLATQVRRREDAEDLVGQVFLEALRGIGRFSGDAAAFKAWLFRIGRDRAVDLARRRDRRPEEPLDAAAETADPTATPDEAVIGGLDRERLWRAVSALPALQRQVIVLRLGSGMTAAEIGRVIGKRTGAVKALQHRAFANLSKALGRPVEAAEAPETSDAGPGVPYLLQARRRYRNRDER